MTASASGVGLVGLEGVVVDVQVADQDGMPGIDITGLPTTSIREARHRVRSALRRLAIDWPKRRLVANFAPADFPKTGTCYDLPLAIALLSYMGLVPREAVKRTLFYGELALDGRIRPVPGAINAALAARDARRKQLLVAPESAGEAAAVPTVDVLPVGHLADAIEVLRGEVTVAPASPEGEREPVHGMDLADVRGQARARRAVEVAAAGGHNLMLIGPPGCGKTLIARAMPTILPPMELEECLEVTRIHSVSGLTRAGSGLVTTRPFRAPHATSSHVALVGGGNPPRPGEASLAHRGVLFLDETPEFRRDALEAMRAPLEDREVTIARAGRRVWFPSSVSLVCAMNPCPCGHLGDPARACRCTPTAIARYRARLSGPLLDRIDLHVQLAPVDPEDLARRERGESSEAVRGRVVQARRRQRERNRVGGGGWVTNAELRPGTLDRFAPLGREQSLMLVRAARRLGLTARSWHRVIKVARTVADLEGAEDVSVQHIAEALTYRLLDRQSA